MNETVTAIGALLAGLAGCAWIGDTVWRAITGQRSTNQASAITGAAKVLVDELQEEVREARLETRYARKETAAAREEVEILRRNIGELRRLTGEEITRLKTENAELLRQIANGRSQT